MNALFKWLGTITANQRGTEIRELGILANALLRETGSGQNLSLHQHKYANFAAAWFHPEPARPRLLRAASGAGGVLRAGGGVLRGADGAFRR
jgi:hypothetical protein